MMNANSHADRYLAPDLFTRKVFNPLVRWLTRRGISVWGSRELRVVGRTSGEIRSVPVNPIQIDGTWYLVAPRGTTQWVRNLRAAGAGELVVGRRTQKFEASELVDPSEKARVLRPYLTKWKFEVGRFFEGVGPDATDAELEAIADNHPIFVLDLR
ncbi:MAG: nitroreductase/quinone reductase family protein [Acidimicrobiales bacterium]